MRSGVSPPTRRGSVSVSARPSFYSSQNHGARRGVETTQMASASSAPAPVEGLELGDDMSLGGGSSEKLTPSNVNRILTEFFMYFVRGVVLFYPVYLTGYLGLSVSWLLLCMLIVTWWKKNRQWKHSRIGTAIDFVDNETQVVSTELKKSLQMASWIQFNDVEKVEWVNKVLEQAWPFFGMFMEKLLRENIQTAVRQSSSELKTFTFTKIHFGHIPLRIVGIKAYTHEVDHREVVLDLTINYEGDVDIDAELKSAITAGVKGLKLRGMIRVILEPLVGEVPLVGGVTFFFIRRPGVVRVHLLEARDLVAKDTYMLGLVKGKSDPYATLRVGDRNVKSKTIKENLYPRWSEVYEFVVHEAPGQELEVEIFDEDTDKDDFIGRYHLDLGEVKKEKEMDQWFPLEGVQSGEVHLKLHWLSLQSDSTLLKQSSEGYACAMLAVYLDNASNLPKDLSEIEHHHKKKHGREGRLTRKSAGPSSFVALSISDDVQKSKVVFSNKDPVWEEGFTFFVHDVKTQQLIVQVKENEKKSQLGILRLPISRFINVSNMMLDQRFLLEQSGVNSQIKLKATLRILTIEQPPPKPIVPPQGEQQIPHSNMSVSSSSALSSNTSPAGRVSSAANPGNPRTILPEDYSTHRRGSYLASEALSSSPATMSMRRYDSHSLLSENALASSRFDLADGTSYPEVILKHRGSLGEINLTLRYATLRNKLVILVNSCRDIFPCSENGTDAYVRLYLLPDQTWRHRKRTHVKKRTVNPVFDEKFEFDVSLEEALTRTLDVAVKNNKMFHMRERKDIGTVLISLAEQDLVKGVKDWYKLSLQGLKSQSRGGKL
ncbi:extended synaptotagmin-3 isoform X2 [Phyllopteryx taeniolatus]|uniref:extended synaptotagmin-3 isoform X2 n=1 Tax=Phyllopteryx taeniolatus TaxID=161469 RepID=UPI002AD4C83A|nr:extended synaptotagmin-3 isoform X2 [Phyllopteryx taeniolatus]